MKKVKLESSDINFVNRKKNHLPIDDFKKELLSTINKHMNTIIVGETGATSNTVSLI